MTWGFLYLLLFLGGFTLVLVTGLGRRILHPTELCGETVVAPSHEHWQAAHAPRSDFLTAFMTVFGLTGLLLHGLTTLDPAHEIAIAAAAGVLGAVLLRTWMRYACHPLQRMSAETGSARVVRDIPAAGFGQIEIIIAGARRTMAARSADGIAIPAGTVVELVDTGDSVAAVRPTSG